eukprot:3952906-Pyramimonas_sp.AAC.1
MGGLSESVAHRHVARAVVHYHVACLCFSTFSGIVQYRSDLDRGALLDRRCWIRHDPMLWSWRAALASSYAFVCFWTALASRCVFVGSGLCLWVQWSGPFWPKHLGHVVPSDSKATCNCCPGVRDHGARWRADYSS